MRTILIATLTLIGVTNPAAAHIGHIGEMAGHDHWLWAGALGAAGAAAAWAWWKSKDEAKDDADDAAEDSEDTPEETPA